MGEGTSSTRFTAGLSGDARVVGEMKAFSGAFCEFGEVWGAREHAGEGEIEVERWPVQAAAATDDLKVPLGGRRGGVKERVQPGRRYGKLTTSPDFALIRRFPFAKCQSVCHAIMQEYPGISCVWNWLGLGPTSEMHLPHPIQPSC